MDEPKPAERHYERRISSKQPRAEYQAAKDSPMEHKPRLITSRSVAPAIHGAGAIGRFNSWLAVHITKAVGTMWAAYLFVLIALVSFPEALMAFLRGDTVVGIAWLSQSFLQLILLPIIIVVGTGTSYHGALAGQFMLRSAGIDAWAVRAFEFAGYPPALRQGDGLVLLSHRGSKHFSRQSLDLFDQSGMPWVAITGEGSAIEGAADEGFVRTVEQEKSPVHTASHTGAMLRLAQIAAALGKPSWRAQLADLPDAVAAALDWRNKVAEDVRRIDLQPVVHIVDGRPARASAHVGALKQR